MHPVFLAKFKNAREAGDRAGTVVEARMPGTSYVDARAASPSREGTVAASTSSQASGPAASISSESGSFFSRLLRDSEEKKPESAAKLLRPRPESRTGAAYRDCRGQTESESRTAT